MERELTTRSPNLLKRLEIKQKSLSEDNPFYWYIYLYELGKRAQTKEVVDEAVKGFSINNPSYTILKIIAKKHLTREVCKTAVSKNGFNLRYVPEQYRDIDMCLAAVHSDGAALIDVPKQILIGKNGFEICFTAICNDFSGTALSFVPDFYLHENNGKILCETAVHLNGYALKYVPARFITKELAKIAIKAHFPVKELYWPDGSCTTRSAYHSDCPVLSLVPEELMSEELVTLSAQLYPESLQYAPVEFVSRNLCFELIKRDPMNLQYLPEPDKELVDYALKLNPWAILAVPATMLSIKLCRDALRRDSSIPVEKFPENIREKLEKEFRSNTFIKYKPVELETPASIGKSEQIVSDVDETHDYNLSDTSGPVDMFYYITDIHLEHQLVNQPDDILKLSLPEMRCRINEKIAELLASVTNTNGTLLIGGDVADSIELEALFYEQLASFDGWRGEIIAVLGNHELWDGDPTGLKPARPIDDIIDDYRLAIPNRVILLENELLIVYKGFRREILDEKTILDASVEELTEVCTDSTFILLGGIGFSGLNPFFNAEMGLYRRTVSTKEDIARSKRFRAVYEKVLTCAKNLRVIVLTHMQMIDWTNARYNPKWIYVSGHTHQNTSILQQDGTTVFSDNQVGYKPKHWHLNNFTINVQRYDPFNAFPNGIYSITREQYDEFNYCQGISVPTIKYPGDLYVLKYNGIYMFVLKSKSSLCLLDGGQRHKLAHDINYYYKNIPEYIRKTLKTFTPYQKALSKISAEVKALGGDGTIHGCIVDIDWYNHIYLNPVDGKITPYYALNMTNKIVFSDVESLLKLSPYPPLLSNGKSVHATKEKKISVLTRNTSKEWKLATLPQAVLDRSMYEPSHIMRSIQYMLDQNILRFWDDTILSINDNEEITN